MERKVITNQPKGLLPYLKRVWQYRSLIVLLARRDLKVKYAQTVLGLVWTVIQPLTGLLIFTIFFDKLIQIDTLDTPYPLFAFSGMISWFFFTYIIIQGGMSLLQSQDLLTKVYFPRIVLPLSKALTGLTDFVISVALMFVMMLATGHGVTINIIWFPLFVLLNIFTGLSVAVWLSALTVRYRDFHHIIPYLVNFGIWLTPVFYPATLLPSDYHFLIYLNPMAGVIDGFRFTLLGDPAPSLYYLPIFAIIILQALAGLYYFRKIEGKIADTV